MDRKATIGYVLIFIIIAVTFFLNQENAAELEKITRTEDSLKQVKRKDSLKQIDKAPATAVLDSGSFVESDTIKEKLFDIENNKLKISISNKGAKITSAALKEYKTYRSYISKKKTPLVLLNNPKDTFNYKIYLKDGVINTSGLTFIPSENPAGGVKLEATLPSGGKVKMTYALKPNSYVLSYKLELEDLNDQIPNNQNFIDFKWVNNIGLAERAVESEKNATTVYYKFETDSDVENLSETESEDKKVQKGLQWVSFKQKFFNTTLINKKGFDDIAILSSNDDVDTAECVKRLSASVLLPYNFNSNEKYEFEFFIGPNHYQTLKKEGIELQKLVSLGFFGWVNKFIIIPIFNWLAGMIENFGLVILLLTLVIKSILFPLVYKSYVSSAKMRILKPEIDEIKEKYGSDMTRMQQENMKLYKKAGVSPLGGCFPMLLQLPILLALFNFFPGSIELRQKSFVWATDLSTYDSVLELGFNIPFYGSHISLFTLLMTISTLIYTRMNNQITGVSGQMKYISYFMPILFLGFFNNYASGLTYYYFLSNMITFGQNILIRRFFVDEAKLHKKIEENKKKPVVIKKSGFQKRLEEMARKNAAKTNTNKNLKKR
ncbi:MAG: membrane protein insertase YidC [Flavobacteriales bacterium]|nr:membrane protein insertase YidC [Flavobacteriales bacterium]